MHWTLLRGRVGILVPSEPRWHRIVRALYLVMFVLVWFEAVGCFVYFMILSRAGSPVATNELAAGIVNHGHVFYVATRQKRFYEMLLTTMQFGIPGIMATGLFLHHVVRVRIFDN